jgi:hypothetical protein
LLDGSAAFAVIEVVRLRLAADDHRVAADVRDLRRRRKLSATPPLPKNDW